MPYFKRSLFAEMQKAPPQAPRLESDEILGAASEVLALDGTRQTNEGPFRLRSVLRPGESGQIVLGISADADGPTTTVRLVPGDLISNSGRIEAAQVKVEPSVLAIGPGGSQDVTVAITVPPDLSPGRYVGPLTASGEHGFVAALEVIVQR